MSPLPTIRIQACNDAPVRADGNFVLYWMIAARRLRWNFALDRAVHWCAQLGKPLVILESLRWDFPWASDRIRRFVVDGMAENAQAAAASSALYYPYVERNPGEGKGLLAALASRAAVVVTDEFPCFFLPRMVAAAAQRAPILMEQVDSNGLLPLRAATKEFTTAYAFRRFLQRSLPEYLLTFPNSDPLQDSVLPSLKVLPKDLKARWPMLSSKVATSKIPHGKQFDLRGGSSAAKKRLELFLRRRLPGYLEGRNDLATDGTSGLAPYLHFGHIAAHEIFSEVVKHERWKPERLGLRPTGSRAGWWGMSAHAEAFLDQLITWRELGFNMCSSRTDYDRFESLPGWAQRTLLKHAEDQRSYTYTLEEFESARTHDALWNAAQTQLVTEGRIHNYLRMLWGKKILEWTRSPEQALQVMVELNNRYALDGRDPNSYSGIFWCLGRYDHPWGPERPIFGSVRYMSSANTARKLNVKEYLRKYTPNQSDRKLERPRAGK